MYRVSEVESYAECKDSKAEETARNELAGDIKLAADT